MTDDPERLLSAHSDADPLERELLASVRDVDVPAGAKDKAWRAIAAQVAAGAVATGALSATSSAAAVPSGVALPSGAAGLKSGGALLTSAFASKIALAIAVGGVATGSYFAVHRGLETDTHDHAPQREPRASIAPAQVGVPVQPTAEPKAAAEPDPVAKAKRAPEQKPSDRLAAESALLTQARASLRAGDSTGAHAALERLAQQFPHGVLVQEREVLAIELLTAQGNIGRAKQRAHAFVRAYPKSPHSAKLQSFSSTP